MLWLVVIFSFLFAVLAYKKLDWAILFLFFGLPGYLIRFQVLGIPFTLLESMILIAFFVWFLKDYKQQTKNIKNSFGKLFGFKTGDSKLKSKRRYPFDKEIALLLVISFLSAGVAGFSNEALGIWKAYFFEPVLIFILILNNFQKGKDYKKIIYSLAACSLLLSAYAWVQKFTGCGILNEFWQAEASRRVTSVFPYPNALALFLAPLLAIFWSQFVFEFKKTKEKTAVYWGKFSFLFLSIVLGLGAIYFARSEGALVAFLASLLIFYWLKGGLLRWFTYAVMAVVLVFLIFSPAPRSWVVEKASLKDLSGEIRKQQWRETWQVLTQDKKTFLLGTGLATYQEEVAPYHQEGIFYNKDKDPLFRTKLLLFNKEYKAKYWQPVETYLYPHNIFLNFWTELGFAGMLLFIWIIFKFLYLGLRNLRIEIAASWATARRVGEYKEKDLYYLNLGLLCAMAVILIHGLVDVPYFKNDLAVIFWTLLGLISLVNLDIKYNLDEKN